MSKKNLDKLFQEKFSNFSDVPTEKVWKSIETSLNEKKKNHKIIPFWWKLGGIAAVMAIGLFLTNPFKDHSTDPNTTTTDIEQVKEDHQGQITDIEQSPIPNTPEVVRQTPSDNVKNEVTTGVDTKTKPLNTTTTIAASSKNQGKVANSKNQATSITQQPDIAQITVQDKVKKDKKNANENTLTKENESAIAVGEQIANNEAASHNPSAGLKSDNNKADGNDLKTSEIAISALEPDESEEKIENDKKSIFEALETQEEEIAEAKENKWSAGPSIAPVYFNAIGNGSPVHSIFVPNSKSGDVNLSYGLAVSYEISKKLSVKTGIHKVDYGYNTNEVEFSSTLESFGTGQIENINYSNASRNIIVDSKANNISTLTSKTASDAAAQDPSLSGVMAQQFGYLEIPLELKYALVDTKFGVDLIGGFSSLFLLDNAVSLTSGELTTEMGEANNLNTMNFSTNIGLGVNYKFTSKVELNIEPIFKYQLNTFSDTAGDFRPFTIGVYSGLNFKF
jgi:hypothetical protein